MDSQKRRRPISSVHVDIADFVLNVFRIKESERGQWVTSLAEALAERNYSHPFAGKLLKEVDEYRKYDVERKRGNSTDSTDSTDSPPRAEQSRTEQIKPEQKNKNTINGKNEPGRSAPGEIDPLKRKFDEARKAYPGSKRGLETEWSHFLKKHGKRKAEIVPLLMAGVERYKAKIQEAGTEQKFIKHFQGWITDSRWADEYPAQKRKDGPRLEWADDIIGART